MNANDELSLARQAAEGNSAAATELRQRIVRCAVAVARKTRWADALDAGDLEDDIPNEVLLRLITRVRRGFEGEAVPFQTYLYRVVTSVAADAVLRNLNRRKVVSLDTPFENAEGGESSLRDFIENEARIGRMQDHDTQPADAALGRERSRELSEAMGRLDEFCRMLIQEAVVNERPHAAIARENKVSVQLLDVSLKRCTERLYRNLLTAYASGPERVERKQIAAAAEQLPADLRVVFLPWWNENHSVKRIAEDQGLTNQETRRRLARAKAFLWSLVGA